MEENTMKKLLSLALVLVMMLTLVACPKPAPVPTTAPQGGGEAKFDLEYASVSIS